MSDVNYDLALFLMFHVAAKEQQRVPGHVLMW